MTGGGHGRTGGGPRGRARTWLAALAVFAAIGLAFAVVNAVSAIDDHARFGRTVEPWKPWTWELTSYLAWLLLAPAVFWIVEPGRPPRWPWPAVLIGYALLSVPFSVAHVALMHGLREAAYAAAGDIYRAAGSIGEILLYEYRKDVITFAALVLLLPLAGRLLGFTRAGNAREDDSRVEVRDGSRTIWLRPEEIEWAQAAGNYVELFGAFGTLLHRNTLSALEAELTAHGFCRIHRARIVRKDAIRSIDVKPSGDFELLLASGARLTGSRRYRLSTGTVGVT